MSSMPDWFEKRLLVAFLILSVLVLLEYPMQLIFDGGPILLLSCCSLFILMTISYSYSRAHNKKNDLLFNYTFLIYIALSFIFVLSCAFTFNIFPVLYIFISDLGESFVFYIAFFFAMALGAYLICVAKRRRIGIALFILVFAVLLFYHASGYFHVKYTANDEEITMLYSIKGLLNGTNPYAISMSRLIYFSHIFNGTSFTLTSNNSFVGTTNYPALFFITFLPFYFLSAPTINNLQYIDMPTQAAFFIFALLVTVYFIMDRKKLLESNYGLYFFLALFLAHIISVATYLMLAVILLAYVKLNSRYSWLLLGVAASLQEELWIPVLLLIAYSFNTYGLRKGAKDLAGAVAVFLLFNGYFIFLGPSQFFNSVFTPVSSFLPMDPSAPIGYFIFAHYGVVASVFTSLFAISVIGCLIILLYFNNKGSIPLLSAIPFMFLTHALVYYYIFFIAMLAILAYSKQEKYSKGAFGSAISKNIGYRRIFTFGVVLLFVFAVLLVYLAHLNYVNALNLSVTNQSAYIMNNTLYYNATLHCDIQGSNLSQLSVLFNLYGHYWQGFYGLFNTSILNGSVNCTYPCSININRIMLNPSNNTYRIYAIAHNLSGPYYASVFLYYGKYGYNSAMVSAKRIR